MSNPILAASGEDLGAVIQDLQSLQVEPTDDNSPGTRKNTGESERKKLGARDLLATLSRKRISIKEILFIGGNSQSGGAYGDVVVATLIRLGAGAGKRQRRVAVKKLRFIVDGDMTEEKFLRVFVDELRLLDKLSHPNIVKIIGFVEDMKNHIAWLVFPWENNGNLREFLLSGKWEIPERIRNVASGLEYLHTQQPPICHGDLKWLNILVNSSHRAVITDFGSARTVQRAQDISANPKIHSAASASDKPEKTDRLPQLSVTLYDTTLTLTGPACSLRWSSPEVLNGEPPDLATDIWALGWIAWEAITDCYPFDGLKGEGAVIMKIIEGRLPLIHDHTQLAQILPLCNLMQKCWKSEPEERPSATECNKALEWMPRAIPMVKSGGGPKIRSATLLILVGDMHRSQGRREDASKSYKQGLAIARLVGNQATVTIALIRLADNDWRRAEYVEAEASYSEALAICESIKNDRGRANALQALGSVERDWSKFVEAEASYTKALAIYESIGDNLGRANVLEGLGDIQEARHMYVEAEASYTQALAIFESNGDGLGRANLLDGLSRANLLDELGKIQLAQSKYVGAEAFFTKALVAYESIWVDLGRVYSTLGLVQIRLFQARYTEAKTLIKDALLISEKIDSESGKNLCHQLLEQVLESERSSTEPPSFW